jgi:hypothetical protein
MGELVDAPCPTGGSGVVMDPNNIEMARQRISGDPIRSSYYSIAWIDGTANSLPSRDPSVSKTEEGANDMILATSEFARSF